MLEKPMLAGVLVPFVRGAVGAAAGDGRVETLAGDASTRRYHRVYLSDVAGVVPASVVVMELPDDALRSDEATGGAAPTELPFLNVQRTLAAAGYPVPRVLGKDLSRGLLALEDLGDRTFESAVVTATAAERAPFYRRAIDLVVELQALGARGADPDCIAFSRRFDEALLRWELAHFREWYLEAERKIALSSADARVVEEAFDAIARTLAAEPVTLVHRDFQSRNLMLVGDGKPELRVIDFQDALLGTCAYDLVALLRDSYVALGADEVNDLVGYFIERAGIADAAAFRRLFVLQTLQRKLKDAGRFVFIDRVRNNPSFLRWIPTTIEYVRDALAQVPAELVPLARVLGAHVPELAGGQANRQ